ncbi:MAG: class A beta-lactamase-related serine hydrolase [Planctomycetota bacterium]|nr:MAG: class A beta-lactamase-related serine hydrolase [Planctomycetota bacterium]
MNANSKIALSVGCMLWAACGTPSSRTPDLDTIRRIGESAVHDDGIVGLSIAVSLHGRVIFAEGFGHADLERTTPANEHTIYDIASVGKQYTSVAVLKLVDEGELSLNDRIRELVPQTPAHFPNATLEELLRHTSGFASGVLDELDPPVGLDQPRTGLEWLDDGPLRQGRIVFQPSETFLYSNSGYLMLGLAIEAASGRPYAEYVAEELLEPAGLHSTTVCQRPDSPLMADSLHRTEAGIARVPFIHMSTYGGAGSICASVTDLIAWEHALEAGRLISRDSLERFRTPSRVRGTVESAHMPYGMGQRLGTFRGHRKVGHTGTFDGGSASLAHFPDAELTIAVLTNTRGLGTPHARAIETEIAAAFLAPESTDWPPRAVPLSIQERRQIEGHYDLHPIFGPRVMRHSA